MKYKKEKEVIIKEDGPYKNFKGKIIRDKGVFVEIRTIRQRDGGVVDRLFPKEKVEIL